MSEALNPPRGMRDIVDEEAGLYEYLFEEFRETARSRGFEPIITPTVEHFKLFEAKSGEEIRRSMYVFEDKAGRLLALRPEVTASVVRAYIKHLRARPKPIRLYYVAQCFRYEEPQFARYREFWQGGLEVIGDPDVNADLLAAVTASEFLDRVGIRHYYKVGNVLVYRSFMKRLGLDEEFQDHVLHLIDKGLIAGALDELKARLDEESLEPFKKLVEAKSIERVESIVEEYKPVLMELYDAVRIEQERTRTFIDVLKELGYNAEYDPQLVRGLAYYTGLIFEYKAVHEEMSHSIGGGGRYDGLSTVYGAPYEYFTGLALGIDRIALVLGNTAKPRKRAKIAILLFGNIPLDIGYKLCRTVKLDNAETFVYRAKTLSRALEYANKMGCRLAIIVGEREASSGRVVVKDMNTGEQRQVEPGMLATELKKLLGM